MRYFSIFAGIGGFEYGIRCAFYKQLAKKFVLREGWDWDAYKVEPNVLPTGGATPLCVGFSEVDKWAKTIYKQQFKGHKDYGDATRIKWDEVEDFELLVGGFPCQAFSIAGQRRGFNDTRGTLFFEIAKALREKQPRLFLIENVRGLLSHDKGHTFFTILTTLDDLGYDLQWEVCNSKDFGVPQNRDRVFIVGHLRGTSRPKVFPFGRQSSKDAKESGKEQKGRSWVSTLDSRYGERWSTETYVRTEKKAIAVLTPDRAEKRQNGRRMKEDGEPSFTLTGQDIHGVYNGDRIRRLTPIECERLQGFPDNWTKGLSDCQRYKCLGNAVTTNVITAIIERMYYG